MTYHIIYPMLRFCVDAPIDQDPQSSSSLDRIQSSRTFHILLVNRAEDDRDYRTDTEHNQAAPIDEDMDILKQEIGNPDYDLTSGTPHTVVKHETKEVDLKYDEDYSEVTTSITEDRDMFKQELITQIPEREFINCDTEYQCNQSDHEVASTKSSMIQPIINKQEFVKFSCSQCDYRAKRQETLKMHIQSLRNGVKYPCNQCDYKAIAQSSLKIHIQSIHNGVKYQCDQCEFKARRQANLKRHIQSVHDGVKYSCDQCDYKATAQSSLKMHIQSIHNGVKYPCNQCDYKATQQSSLKRHIQSVHNGVKYLCDQCDFKAGFQGSLKIHIESVHDGLKYPCDQCDYKATQQSSLKRHIQSVHKKI